MEQLVDISHGPTVLVACLVIVLALHLALKLGEFVFDLAKKRGELTEKNIERLIETIALNTQAQHSLEHRMRTLEDEISDFSKSKIDIKRLFSAVKTIAGPEWPQIRQAILDDDITHT